jgi:hypothetical protein
MPINPAFLAFPSEAAIIGRIVIAFGELELMLAEMAGKITGPKDAILRMVYGMRMTSARVDACDELIREPLLTCGLEDHYSKSMAAVRFCLKMRNTFAHCHWGHNTQAGLFYTNLQDAAERPSGFAYHWKHVDVALLEEHEKYLNNTQEMLWYLDHEQALRRGVLKSHVWPKPPDIPQPSLHNPASLHVPPWLSEDAIDLHIAHALAAEGGAPTPTPAQEALEQARAEKRARRQADRDRAKEGRSPKPDDPDRV